MNKLNLDQGWEFTEAAGFFAMHHARWQPVTLPHDAMIGKPRAADNPSRNNGAYFPGGIANYRKKFSVPEAWRGQCVQLEFEGVYMNAEVSVNNQLVHIQPYGYSSFIVDLTPHLKIGQENTLGVVANNTAQPNCRWYSGTGIYRHVWLRSGGDLHIPPWGVFVTTPVVEAGTAVVQVATRLESQELPERAVLRSTVVDAQGAAVAQAETAIRLHNLQQTLLVKNPKLWSLEAPNLYTLLSEVLVDGKLVDSEKTTFGIRSIGVDADHGLRLNGVTIEMKGGCIHHDLGPLGAASYDRAEERRVEILKSGGYNAIRTAHNPPSPGLLEACDRLGMLVIDETFDAWTSGKATNDYHLYFREWWQRDTAAMVKRDRNHPCVVMYSIGNEIFEALGNPVGTEWSKRQADYIRTLDSSRFVTSGVMMNFLEAIANNDIGGSFKMKPVPEDPEKDSWGRLTADFIRPLDVVGYNYMAQRYDGEQKRFPGRVIAGTETWGHKMFYFWKETERLTHVIGDFVWTAVDYLGEAGGGSVSLGDRPSMSAPFPYHTSGIGDFNICGFKRTQSYYRDLLWGMRTAPFIAVFDPQYTGQQISFTPWAWEPVLDTWTLPGHEGKPIQVEVYAIDDEVELFVNGISAGCKPAGGASQNKACFEVTYQPGTIEAVGYTAGKQTGRHQLVSDSGAAGLRLTSDREVLKRGEIDLAFVTVEVVDRAGVLVQGGEPLISAEVRGPGELLVLSSGNPLSEELYDASPHKAFHGKLLAVVRTGGQPGEIILRVRSEGLPAVEVTIGVK